MSNWFELVILDEQVVKFFRSIFFNGFKLGNSITINIVTKYYI